MIANITHHLKNFFFPIAVLFTSNAFSQVITVTTCNLKGWVNQQNLSSFTTTVSDPPVNSGTLEFFSSTGSLINFRSTAHHKTLLSSITVFKYSSFIQSRVNTTDAPYVVLQIDRTGDNLEDDRILFEPRWQTGHYVIGKAPDQGLTIANTWQTWDMLNGIWWLGPPPRPNPDMTAGVYFSLASYIVQYPNAKIVNQFLGGGTGGIRLNVGAPPAFIPSYWGGSFRGNVDAFTIAVNGNAIVYDFEASIANAGADNTVVYGYGSNCTTLNGTGAGGVATYSYSWSGGGITHNGQNVTVCPTETTTYTLTVTDAQGCRGTDQVTVNVQDVRCGTKNNKVLVCHNGEELCISPAAVKAHLDHGDVVGSCSFGLITNANPRSSVEKHFRTEVAAQDQFKIINYPNPFVNRTTIQYQLPFDCAVSLKVFDQSGRVVSTLVSGNKQAGLYSVEFSSKNISKGVYFYTITASSAVKTFTKTNKMVVLQ
jgi:hypothetical protein